LPVNRFDIGSAQQAAVVLGRLVGFTSVNIANKIRQSTIGPISSRQNKLDQIAYTLNPVG
jgi:hypothetical protein